jgi:hypothetical protein
VCNLSTCEAEAGGLRVQGQPELHSQTLSQNNNDSTKKTLILHGTVVHACSSNYSETEVGRSLELVRRLAWASQHEFYLKTTTTIKNPARCQWLTPVIAI